MIHTEPSSEEGGHPAIAIAGTFPSQRSEPGPDPLPLSGHHRRWNGVGPQTGRPDAREPVSILDHRDRPAALCRARNFPPPHPPSAHNRGQEDTQKWWIPGWGRVRGLNDSPTGPRLHSSWPDTGPAVAIHQSKISTYRVSDPRCWGRERSVRPRRAGIRRPLRVWRFCAGPSSIGPARLL